MAGSSARPPEISPRRVRTWGAARVARTVTTTSTATPPSSGRRRGDKCGGGGEPQPGGPGLTAAAPRPPGRGGPAAPGGDPGGHGRPPGGGHAQPRPEQRSSASRCASGTADNAPDADHNPGRDPAPGTGPQPQRRRGRRPAPRAPCGPQPWTADSPCITTGGARAAQGAVAALTDPVDRPQPLGRGQVLAAPLSGQARGGPGAGLAVRRQPPATAAPVKLTGWLDLATAGTALGPGTAHAAAPSVEKAASSSASNRSTGSSTSRSLSSRSSRART
jgi:hypothetical protein